MITIRWMAALLALICFIITFATFRVDGVTLLGTLAFAACLWTFGAFSKEFWQ